MSALAHRRRPALAAAAAVLLLAAAGLANDQVEGLKTFSQADYGAGKNADAKATEILDRNFDKAFDDGLMVGRKGKEHEHYVIASAEEVRRLLPIQGPPAVLKRTGDKQNLLDCGGLAGQLIAAKLNVEFDSRGALGKRKDKGETPLKRLRLHKGVQRSLQGMEVRELIELADRTIAGEYGQRLKASKKVIDVDDDGDVDASLMDLREALRTVNATYRAGRDVGKGLDDEGRSRSHEDEDEEIELTEEAEEEIELAEEERDDELLEAEEERDDELERLDEKEERKGSSEEIERARRAADERYRARKKEIDRKFEAKEERIREEWRKRHGKDHPGQGKGLKGEHPGKGKGHGKGQDKKG